MESKKRNVWIAVAAMLVVVCCGTVAVAAVVAGSLADRSFDWDFSWDAGWDEATRSESQRIERTFNVGNMPQLEVNNFAGSITVQAGKSDTVNVVAIKKVKRNSDLSRIEIKMSEARGGVVIQTRNPTRLNSASVQLEITAPAGTRLDLDTGAGSVVVLNMAGDVEIDSGAGDVTLVDATGQVDAHTGAGSIDVRGAAGTVRLHTGAGSIDYAGAPGGNCRFNTGAGDIRLVLPASLRAQVDLDTGTGTINVGFNVDGRVTKRHVQGSIDAGDQGTIQADTGTGNIDLIRR
jgi:DUF4097 and DUF4098 domain-containing protein YvlB